LRSFGLPQPRPPLGFEILIRTRWAFKEQIRNGR
jgi:hypothetical protein